MTNYHTIRLHGPWQADFFSSTSKRSTLASVTDSPSSTEPQRIKLPLVNQVWIKPEFEGVVELSRHFNWPHKDESAIYIRVDSDVSWTVSVNDQPVFPFQDAEQTSLFSLLQPQNLLCLRAELTAQSQPEIREVSLKIA